MKRLRLVSLVTAVLLSLTLSSSPALAGVSWCEDDPVFLLNGGLVDLTTGVPAGAADSVRSIVYDVRVPSNTLFNAVIVVPSQFPTKATVSATLPAWTGRGEMPVVAYVTVKATKSFEIYTRAVAGNTTLIWNTPGRSNVTTTMKFKVLAP